MQDQIRQEKILGVARLARLHDRLDTPPVYDDLAQRGRPDGVVLPQVVVHHLEVPGPFTSAGSQSDQAGAVKVVTRTEATVVIDGCAIGWNVNQVVRRIRRDGSP